MLDKLRARFSLSGDLVLFVVIAISLIPVWVVPFFPSQDGPSHVENAELLLNYWNLNRPEIREFYQTNPSVTTNWLGHVILAALLVAAPPLLAEKLFLSAYVILLPLSAWYLLRAHSPRAGWFALLVIPFVYSVVLYKGFYNFCASLPLYFFMLGYFLRQRDGLDLRATFFLLLLSLLLYGAHVITWTLGALALAIFTLSGTFTDFRARTSDTKIVRQRILPFIAIVLIPSVLLFLFITRGTGAPLRLDWNGLGSLWNLARLTTLVALDDRDFYFAAILAAGLGILLLVQLYRKTRDRRWNRWDTWLPVIAAYLVVYLLAPGSIAGGSFVKQRLVLFVCFAAVFWLGAQEYSNAFRLAVQGAATLWLVGLVLVRMGATSALSAHVADLHSAAPLVAPHSTILPLTFATHAEQDPDSTNLSRIRILLHGAGYLAAERQAVNLANYEARTDYFPLVYNPQNSPEAYARRLASGTPVIDLAAYERERGVQVQYVLLLAEDAPFGESFAVPESIANELAPNYTLAYTSPLGHALLYVRK